MSKKLLLIAIILGIKAGAQCTPLNLPYTENFETVTTSLPPCTKSESVDTGGAWRVRNNSQTGINSRALSYVYAASEPANAWFMTPGLNLTGGIEYKLSYKYSGSTGFVQKLKVAYGMGQTNSSMNTQITNHPNITDASVNTVNITFKPETTGVYYIGFNCYSGPDQNYLKVDDISVTTDTQLNVQNVKAKTEVKVYPNPFTDVFNVSQIENVRSVSITDVSGRVMRTIDKPSSPIYAKDFMPGSYRVKLEMKDGSQKIIKAIKK